MRARVVSSIRWRRRAMGAAGPSAVGRALLVGLTGVLAVAFLPGCLPGSSVAPSVTDIYRLRPRTMRRFRFPGGLEVLLERDASLPAVAVVAVVGAGSTRDPPAREGLAHVVEHLSFLARQPDGRTRARTLTDLGATWNATTSWDATTYYEIGPRATLPRLLELESARLLDPLAGVTESDLSGERGVVLNELQLRGETQAIGQVIAWLQAAALPATDPYARPVGGTEQTVSAATLADARAFAAGYRAAPITLCIAGDIDLAAAPEILGRLPAALTGGPPVEFAAEHAGDGNHPGRRPTGDSPSEPLALPALAPLPRYRAAVTGPELWLTWTLPGAYAGAAGIEHLLAKAAEAALEEHDLRALDISAASLFIIEGAHESLLVCRAWLVSGGDPEAAFGALAARVSQKWRETVYDPYWFSYLRGQTATSWLLEEDGLLGRALSAADLAHFDGDPDQLRQQAVALGTIDYSKVADVGKRYIVKERARGIFVSPLPPEARPAPRAVGVDRARVPPPAGGDAALAQALRSARRLGEAILQTTLRNGLQVVAIQRPAATMAVLLGFSGGTADGSDLGAAEAFSFAGEFQVKRPPATFGMTFNRRYTRDDVVEVLRGPAVSLESTLQFLKQEEEIYLDWPSRQLFKRVPAIAHSEGAASVRAERALWQSLFGNLPYANTALVKDILALSKEQVRAWWLAHRRPDNALLVVVSELDPARVVAAARAALGSWRAPSHPDAGPAAPPPPTLSPPGTRGSVIITHRPGAVQAEVTMACRLPSVKDGDAAAGDLLATVINDDLWTMLREGLGGSYDVTTYRDSLRGGVNYLTARAAIDNSHLPAALSSIRDYWHRGHQPLTPAAIETARWESARKGFLSLATSASVARKVFEYWNLGWPLDEVEKYPQRIADLPAGALAPILEVCEDNFVLSIVGDEPTIRAAWR